MTNQRVFRASKTSPVAPASVVMVGIPAAAVEAQGAASDAREPFLGPSTSRPSRGITFQALMKPGHVAGGTSADQCANSLENHGIQCAVPGLSEASEEWRPVVGFPGYEVSNLGRVRSFKRSHVRLLSQHEHYLGYLRVLLHHGTQHQFYVHRLVAEAFIGPRPDGMEVDHVNGNKRDCRPENLEYVSRSENLLRAFRMGLCKPMRGEKCPASKLSRERVLEIFAMRVDGDSRGVARRLGLSAGCVDGIWSGKTWSHTTGKAYSPVRSEHRCGSCGEVGHNRRACPRALLSTPPHNTNDGGAR